MPVNHLELFAGIGGFRRALELLCHDFNIESKNIGFSEIEPNAVNTYKANYDTSSEFEIGDIVAFTSNLESVKALPNFELLSGGFPCQSFSMMGKQKGFNDMRGNVFFQILKIAECKKPQIILLENVKNILTHNKGETFKIVIDSIKKAGYPYVFYDVFNTCNFGLPQVRNRVFIFASKKKLSDNFVFSSSAVIDEFNKVNSTTSLIKYQYTYEILEKDVNNKYFLSDIIKPTILADGSKNFKSNSSIDQLIAKPLTATMAKMHRACQDNYFSLDYINSETPIEYTKKIFTKEELIKKQIRRITPKEAFLLQGFDSNFFEKARAVGTSDSQLYKQAGNAVSVNTVYAILYYLIVAKNVLGE